MEQLIVKSCGYIFLIILGYMLKRMGIFDADTKSILGKLLLYITLPFAFIANFRSFQKDELLVCYFLIGFVTNIISIWCGRILCGHRECRDRAMYLIECSGYNIGAFATPIIGSMLPGQATVVSSMFDIGNSIMCIGGIYPLSRREIKEDKGNIREQIMFIVKNLFSSIPFDTYLVMLFISLAGIRLPSVVSDVAGDFGAPSIIITMIMIGISFEINVSKEDVSDIVKILALRYVLAVLFIIGIRMLPMLDEVQKQTLSICVFAPVTSISTTYCNMCGCKAQVYGAVSSISVIISMIIYVVLMS